MKSQNRKTQLIKNMNINTKTDGGMNKGINTKYLLVFSLFVSIPFNLSNLFAALKVLTETKY